MPGKIDIEALGDLVGSGEIDTVVAAFTDMQGRLIGKRFTGHYFLESGEGRMARLRLSPGDRHGDGAGAGLQGRVLGQGLWRLRASSPISRRCGASPGSTGTALVLSDVLDHHGEELPH